MRRRPEPKRRRPSLLPLLLAVIATCLAAVPRGDVRAQAAGGPAVSEDALMRGLELEQNGKYREAAAAFRRALSTPNAVSAMLGLERVLLELGYADSVLAIVDSVIRTQPRNPTYRTIQLRTLAAASRPREAAAAFEAWVIAQPRDVAPYREWARMLLQEGRAAAADTVLQRAERTLGTARGLAAETAQLRAAMRLWEPAARSWREAVADQDYLFQAAAFSLQPAPEGERAVIRRALMALPVEPGARRIIAALEMSWGNPREGWAALRGLHPDDAGLAAWRDFAELAEGNEAWLAAADAFAALYARRGEPALAARAARAALSGGDARYALDIMQRAMTRADSAQAARLLLAPYVRALTALGRAAAAESALVAYLPHGDRASRDDLERSVAWGWVRAGDPTRARAVLARAGLEDDDEIGGWLALYEGDVATARERLRGVQRPAGDQILALAFVVRTRAAKAPEAGRAFLALARGDTATAARGLVSAAAEAPDAAALLLGAAARLHATYGEGQVAASIWQRLLTEHASSPEAAEADLAWGRQLARRGDRTGAAARFEHLILTYPESALVPQARRELDLLQRGAR